MIRVWLEWVETICVFLTLIAFIFALLSGSNFFWLIFLTITIILNILNRWRLEQRTKARMSGIVNIQSRRLARELENLSYRLEMYIQEQKKMILPPKIISNMPKSDDKIIASLQEDVESLNQSLLTVINYLKQEKIELRIKNLETLYESRQSSAHRRAESSPDVQLPDQEILTKANNFDLPPLEKKAWKCIHIIDAHHDSVTDLAITHDNQYLFSSSWDQYLKLWSLAEGQEISRIKASEQGVTTLAIDPINYFDNTIVTGNLEAELNIWSLDQDSLQFLLKNSLQEHRGSIHGLAIAPKSKIIVSGGFDPAWKQWDLPTGHLLTTITDEIESINAIAINESIGLVVVAREDGLVTLWELGSEKKLGLLMGNSNILECLAISHSGDFIVAGCADGHIKIWQLPTTIFTVFLEVLPYSEISAHEGQIMNLLFTSDDQLLYSAGVDGFIKIWQLATAEERGHLRISDDDRILSLALSDDDQILAAGSVEGTIKVWQQQPV